MAKHPPTVRKTEPVLDEVSRLHRAINNRAYELFQSRGPWTGALADWLDAERDLIARPAIEVHQKDGEYTVRAAVAGIEPAKLHLSKGKR